MPENRFFRIEYSKTWWNERVEAVSRIVEAVFSEPDEEEKKRVAIPLKGFPDDEIGKGWEPFWEPSGCLTVVESDVSD